MKILLASAARKITYIIAILVVIAAILLSVSRLSAPIFDQHKNDFENWASQLLNAPVTIGKVRVAWFHYEPEISLNDVTILDKNTKNPNLQIKEVSIFFSLIKSIWQMKPVPSGFMITGSVVNVKQTPSEYTIQGFPALGGFTDQPFQAETNITDMMRWLSAQPYITLRDIDVRYTDSHNIKRYVTFYELGLANNGDHHTVSGKAILHQEIPTEVTTSITWIGNDVDLAKIKANVYLYVSGFSLSQWLKDRTWSNWQVKEGVASAKIWAMWRAGAFRKIQSAFQFYDLNLYSLTDKTEHKITRLSGNVGWKHPRNSNTQTFAGDDILIDLPTHLWPVTNFYVTMQQNTDGALKPKSINFGYIDIVDFQTFLFSSPAFMPDVLKQFLLDFKPSGALENTALTFPNQETEPSQVALNTNFTNLNFVPAHRLPGIKNLSGTLKWDGTQGDIILRSSRLNLNYDAIFANSISIDQLYGDAHIVHEQNNLWKINIASLQLLNNDTAANVRGTITLPPGISPNVDLEANFTLQRATHITRYLPVRILDPALNTWLSQAFLAGEVSSANAILKGNLADFPFDHHNGTFLVSGIVKNVDLNYAPNWPPIKHIDGKIQFADRRITIDVSQGFINKLPLKNIHGEIPNLGSNESQVLTISGDEIHGDFTQGLLFVHASPLEKTIGKMFAGMNLRGPMGLKLGLRVPLKTPENTLVQGDINFKDANLELTPWQLTINNLIGQLHFTEKSTDSKNIQGTLFGKPLQFNLATIQKGNKTPIVEAKFTQNLSISDLQNWLKIPFDKVVQGQAWVDGKIMLALNAPIQIELKSNLVGVALLLPNEFAKRADEAKNFAAMILAQENQPLRMKLNYGNLFDAALILNRKQNQFALLGANIHLGAPTTTDWPKTPGLYITGEFNELKWDKIKEYLNQSSKTNLSNLPPLKNITIDAKKIALNGLNLSKIHLSVTPLSNVWNINISSPDIQGTIKAPVNFNSKGLLVAEFQRLNLHTLPGATSGALLDVKSLPAISFDAENVSVNDMDLGDLAFKAVPNNKGMSIQNLHMSSSSMSLQANGSWTQNNVTNLRGFATSSNVSALLTSFGIDAHNFISSNGQLNFDLNWKNAPYAPSLASLSGSASLNIGRGRIVDVGQGNNAKMDFGKMLSIFSLQSIPRRLTFDFSDLFQKGYSFDYIRGDFSFKKGDAYTSNLRFDGPVARVNINGRIGLSEKDYDFTLSVTPYVTSSLPVAAALLASSVGPVGSVAALAVSTVLGSAVTNVVTYYYSVNGPWTNPVWQTIGRQAEKNLKKA